MEDKKQLVILNLKTNEVDILTIPKDMVSDKDTYIQSFGYKFGEYHYMVADYPSIKVNHRSNGTYGFIGSLTINNQCSMVKAVEQKQLAEKMRGLGINEYKFESEQAVIIACYLDEHPCDFKVNKVKISDKGVITLYGYDVAAWTSYNIELDVFDVFEGHLEYITTAIKKID